MGLFRDLRRLWAVARENRRHMDIAESIRVSADAAEHWSRVARDASRGVYGAAVPDPFANLAFHQRGLAASGRVLSLAPTAEAFEGATVYDVRLEVRIDGREPYETAYRTVIAAAALPNWQPGRVLPFRVSPADPHALLLG
ncbi:hypothetical protein [Microbacterium sp. gxy059]|uniref:hypothetical protein n=1 Tax=Microbacterium sp. gxy059 TaxID=2957199 RepID=UPI003D970B61